MASETVIYQIIQFEIKQQLLKSNNTMKNASNGESLKFEVCKFQKVGMYLTLPKLQISQPLNLLT